MNTPRTKNAAYAALGRLGGKARAKALSANQREAIAIKGSKASAKAYSRLTPEQRTAWACRAAQARWAKAKEDRGGKLS